MFVSRLAVIELVYSCLPNAALRNSCSSGSFRSVEGTTACVLLLLLLAEIQTLSDEGENGDEEEGVISSKSIGILIIEDELVLVGGVASDGDDRRTAVGIKRNDERTSRRCVRGDDRKGDQATQPHPLSKQCRSQIATAVTTTAAAVRILLTAIGICVRSIILFAEFGSGVSCPRNNWQTGNGEQIPFQKVRNLFFG